MFENKISSNNLIENEKIKHFIKQKNLKLGKNDELKKFFDKLNEIISETLEKAIKRCKQNGRRTLMERDL